MEGRLSGKVALVTGSAARGIGRACVSLLAREGATVYATDVNEELGTSEAQTLVRAGLMVKFLELDVRSESDWQHVTETVQRDSGRLDVLVNNAGVAFNASIAETPLDRFRWLNEINLRGTFLGVKHSIIAMRKNTTPGGSIVNLSSIAGHVGMANYVAYCASKGGVKNLTKAAALETAALGDNIRINSVHPGPIWTSMHENLFGGGAGDFTALKERTRAIAPLKLLAQPEDVAAAVLFLASDDSSYMTGAALTIDGGLTAA